MDRAAWGATVHGVARVIRGLATKQPPPYHFNAFSVKLMEF